MIGEYVRKKDRQEPVYESDHPDIQPEKPPF
jgi:hypothetical protein